MMQIGDKVRHISGAWECGCDDTDGTITDFWDNQDEGLLAFVGTPCGWGWIPVSDLTGIE